MPDLARGEACPAHPLAADDEPAADTAADLDEHEVVAAVHADFTLGGVRVIDDEDRQPGRVGDEVAQRHITPAEVGGGVHDATRDDDAGRPDADAEKGGGRGSDHLLHEIQDDRDDRLARVVSDAALGAHEDVAVEVEHRRAEHLVGGEVDTDGLQPGAVEVDEGGRLAGAHLLGRAELDCVAALDHLGDEVGCGHLADAETAGEVGPAHRTRRVEHLEREREVVPAAVAGEHHGARRGPAGSRGHGHES